MPAEHSGIWGYRRPRAAAAAPRARSAPCQGRRVPAEPASPLPPPRPAPHRLRPAPTPAAYGHTSRCHSVPAPPVLFAPPFAAPSPQASLSSSEIRKSKELNWAHAVKRGPKVRALLFSHLLPDPTPPHPLAPLCPTPTPAPARPCLLRIMIFISLSRFSCFSPSTLKPCLLPPSSRHQPTPPLLAEPSSWLRRSAPALYGLLSFFLISSRKDHIYTNVIPADTPFFPPFCSQPSQPIPFQAHPWEVCLGQALPIYRC